MFPYLGNVSVILGTFFDNIDNFQQKPILHVIFNAYLSRKECLGSETDKHRSVMESGLVQTPPPRTLPMDNWLTWKAENKYMPF